MTSNLLKQMKIADLSPHHGFKLFFVLCWFHHFTSYKDSILLKSISSRAKLHMVVYCPQLKHCLTLDKLISLCLRINVEYVRFLGLNLPNSHFQYVLITLFKIFLLLISLLQLCLDSSLFRPWYLYIKKGTKPC